MKTKQLINLGIVLVVISGLVALKQLQKPKELATQEYLPLDLSFDLAQVTGLDVSKPQGGNEQFVELVKTGEAWKLKSLSNARADKEKIETFLKELKSATGELRAKDKKIFKDFGIGDDQAYQVVVRGAENKPLLEIKLGTEKPDDRTTFIRRQGSDQVFLTAADLFSKIGIFGKPKEDKIDNSFWASTILVELDPAKVQSIQITHIDGGRESVRAYPVRQSPTEWIFGRVGIPLKIDGKKVENFVTSMQSWRAQKVVDAKAKDYGFTRATFKIDFEIQGGKHVVITAGDQEGESKATYMQVTNEPVVFVLSPYYAENMEADDARFVVDNPLQIDGEKTEQLIVSTDKAKWTVSPKSKKWDDLTKYIEDLKSLNISRFLSQSDEMKKVKSPGKFSIEIKKEGEATPTILDFGDTVKESPKELAANIRGAQFPFAVSDYHFKKYFEETARLNEPPAPPMPAASATSAPVAAPVSMPVAASSSSKS